MHKVLDRFAVSIQVRVFLVPSDLRWRELYRQPTSSTRGCVLWQSELSSLVVVLVAFWHRLHNRRNEDNCNKHE